MKSYFNFLSRNKLYTFIEAVGLAFSLAFVIIIGSYAWQQLSIPRENPDRENIYIFGLPEYPGLTYGFTDVLKEQVPEVECAAGYFKTYSTVLIDREHVTVDISAVSSDFFKIFPYYKLISGTPELLEVKTNVFVSESFANRHSLRIGDVLSIDDSYEVTVAGITEDFKGTLIAYADIIAPINIVSEHYGYVPFDNFGVVVTFAKVVPNTDVNDFQSKVEKICEDIYPNVYGSDTFFEYLDITRLDEIYFKYSVSLDNFNQGNKESLKVLIIVGLLLLTSAVFNYLNLSIALTGRRAKEMASRRLLGASKINILTKYILESVIFTAICFFFALLFAEMMTPAINRLLNSPDVPIQIVFKLKYILGYIAFIVIIGTITGFVPAIMASKFEPVDVVKGSYRAKSKMTFSKIFIVLQNVLAVFMLTLALVMEAQYAKSINRPMNCNISDKYFLFADGNGIDQSPLENALIELPCVKKVGFARGVPGFQTGGQFSETTDSKTIMYRMFTMDSVAFDMLEIEILKDFGTPKYNSVWFGESAFYATGFDEENYDISNTLAKRTTSCEQIAGIIADIPTNNSNIGAEDYMIVSYQRRRDIRYGGYLIETIGDHAEAAKQIQEVYNEFAEKLPMMLYASSYLEDSIEKALEPTHNNMRLIEIFMLLSILISLLGLMAMSTYYASENAKEIALRKIFGSTINNEIRRIVQRYMLMVTVAIIMAVPVAVWASGKYLEQFIYKIQNYWWIFVVAIILTFMFSLSSILWQTIRAARTNPTESLKKE